MFEKKICHSVEKIAKLKLDNVISSAMHTLPVE